MSLSAKVTSPGGPLAFSATGLPPGLTISPTTGRIYGTLAKQSAGSYTVAVTATAGQNSVTYSFPWTVSETTAPVAFDQTRRVQVGTPRTVTLKARDDDNDPLTFAVITVPWLGPVTLAGHVVTYTPTSGYLGSDSFTFRASDGVLVSNVATVTLNITSSNAPPTSAPDTYSTPHDRLLAVLGLTGVLANDTDPEGEPLQAALVAVPRHGTVALNADGSFTYKISDGAEWRTAAVTLNVHDHGGPPRRGTPIARWPTTGA